MDTARELSRVSYGLILPHDNSASRHVLGGNPLKKVKYIQDSENWENAAHRNKRLSWSDNNQDNRKCHEREQMRAEEKARQERNTRNADASKEERRRLAASKIAEPVTITNDHREK